MIQVTINISRNFPCCGIASGWILLKARVGRCANEGVEVRQYCFLGQRFLNRFRNPEIDYLRDRLASFERYENIRWLQVTMNHSLLMGVLNGVAKFSKQMKSVLKRQLIGVAVVCDTNSANQLHYEVGAASSSCASVKDSGDTRMVHERKRLSFSLEARNNAPRVHPEFYYL